jgi:hypothetical protein
MKTLEQQQAEAREDAHDTHTEEYEAVTYYHYNSAELDALVARIHNETREGVLEECILWSREKTDPYNENTYEDVCSKAGYNRALSDIDTHITSLKKTV